MVTEPVRQTRLALNVDVTRPNLVDWQGKRDVRRFSRFCRTYLNVPHGYNAGEPLKMYPTQLEWVRSYLESPITVVAVARGNAKSTTAAAMAIWHAVDPPEGDLRPEIVIVANSKLQAGAVFDTCMDLCKDSPWLAERSHVYADANNPRILFENGARIRIRTADPKRLQGLIPSLIIGDEIASFKAETWTSLIAALGKRPGARLLGVSTPHFEKATLQSIYDTWQSGQLGDGFRFHLHASPMDLSIDDVHGWELANPVRREMAPDRWLQDLAQIRAAVSDTDFQLFFLCRFIDVAGMPIVEPEQWDQMGQPTLADDEVPDFSLHVAVSGDWARRNVAAVGAVIDGDVTNLYTLGVWDRHAGAVPTDEIMEACLSLGDPASLTFARSMQGTELIAELEERGQAVETMVTASSERMRDATDRFLTLVSSDHLRHDHHELLRAHVLGARVDVDRKGLVIARDDREDPIHAALAAAVAALVASETPVPAIF